MIKTIVADDSMGCILHESRFPCDEADTETNCAFFLQVCHRQIPNPLV